MSRMVDMTGMRIGRLTFISSAGSVRKKATWLCQCECGNRTTVVGQAVRCGKTTSCGCANRNINAAMRMTHGMTGSREYIAWAAMISRCENHKNNRFPTYGARGVRVCERWRSSFENFLADMGAKPSPNHSVDRIDVDGHYEPGNCRWATRKEQARNRRDNRLITALGKTMPLAAWSEATGLKEATIRGRIKAGWDADEAVSRPLVQLAALAVRGIERIDAMAVKP